MPTDTSFDGLYVFGFKGTQAGVKQLPLRHDDYVEAWRDLVATENLSNQSFSSVPTNGSPQLLCGGDAQPRNTRFIGQDEHRAVAAMNSDAPFVDLLELSAPADPFGSAKSHQLSALG